MAVLLIAQAKADNGESTTSGQTPIGLYNPQKPPQAESEAAFEADRFLKHPARIHYERDAQTDSKAQNTHQGTNKTQNREERGRERGHRTQTVIPGRKPGNAAAPLTETRITPPKKPDNAAQFETSPEEEEAAPQAQNRQKRQDANESDSTKAATVTQAESQMPAVPPGEVKADSLKSRSLPAPSDESNNDGDKDITPKDTQDNNNDAFIQTSGGKRGDYQLIFKNGVHDLNTTMRDNLRRYVIPVMEDTPSAKLVIKSYATPDDNGQSSDRRVALSRALKLREFLIRNDLATNRMNIRALGNASDKPPRNRIDLHISSP